MALLVPYVGANIALEALVNKTAPQNLVLNLFANNITPSNTDTAVTYTAATFAGYAPAAISGTGWGRNTTTTCRSIRRSARPNPQSASRTREAM